MASVDPQTQEVLTKIEQILFPIIYGIAGGCLIYTCVRYAFKIHNEPEEKGTYIKHLVISILAIMLVFVATGVGHIFLAKYLGML